MDFREHKKNAKQNSTRIWYLYVLLLLVSSILLGALGSFALGALDSSEFSGEGLIMENAGYGIKVSSVYNNGEAVEVIPGQFKGQSLKIKGENAKINIENDTFIDNKKIKDFLLLTLFIAPFFIILILITTAFGFKKFSSKNNIAKMFGGLLITSSGVESNENTPIIEKKETQENGDVVSIQEEKIKKAAKMTLNIVTELSIAARIPVPKLYLIPDDAINAFSAGKSIETSIVGITRGSLNTFNREEMTAIIAHELGHIVSGDTKLNLKISALIYGFTGIFSWGMILLIPTKSSFSVSKKNNGFSYFGLGLILVGGLMVLFGKILQASMSKQREFLADASAIEFILNVEGLKSVFNKVKNDKALNTKINSKYTTDYSHAFIFGIDTDFMFATHPPLEERIKRLNEWG